jgi:quinohemoprotein ethanol dehydrogenase
MRAKMHHPRRWVVPLTALLALSLASSAWLKPAPAASAQAVDWPSYGNDLGEMRFQDLDQINPTNVAQLQPVWIFHVNAGQNLAASLETQPIVVAGTMYVTSPHGHVFALDAATGDLKWTYNPDLPDLRSLAICCGQTNRGVAVGDGKVFVALLDATLVALDQQTGQVAWKVAVDDWHKGYTETLAPLFVDGKVIVGISGGELMTRGRVTAYDAATGKEVWRFYTTPGPGEVGHDTWAGDSWQTGGAPVWTTPSVDPDLGLIYFGTGNAAPDVNGSQRAGDNLFAASIVAIDLKTGQYRWHFQEVHHDIWDYDAVQPTTLFTLERDGQQIPAIGQANKNGFYFILDRRDGTPLYPVNEVAVPTDPAWQHPAKTQPVPATDPLIPQNVTNPPAGMQGAPMFTPPQETPLLIQPGFETGPEWSPAAYSPRTKFVYIPAGGYEPWLEQAIPDIVNTLGSTGEQKGLGDEQYGYFDALDTTTGKLSWQVKTTFKTLGGAAVAGDLVFEGLSSGEFDAFDARTGEVLWSWTPNERLGNANPGGTPTFVGVGAPDAPAAVYEVDGREYVAVAFGGNFRERADTKSRGSKNGDAIVAFALPKNDADKDAPPHVVTAQPTPVAGARVPAEERVPPVSTPPGDAVVIEIESHDLNYYPNTFTFAPGQKVAIHLKNTGIIDVGIAVELPTGDRALKGVVAAGKDAYFVFTAPEDPGTYQIYSPAGGYERFLGLTGTMVVAAPGTPTTSGTS